jgi:hypothetical protein
MIDSDIDPRIPDEEYIARLNIAYSRPEVFFPQAVVFKTKRAPERDEVGGNPWLVLLALVIGILLGWLVRA